jgi:LPS O-antigen subunit length determinant protein (WzzB/FepE family)
MQQNTPEQNYYQEDEIDLKELFKILWLKKNLIISITAIITIMAGVYAFNKTPIYEGTALVEIGNYKNNNNNNNNNNNVLVDSVPELVKKLNLLFIDLLKNEKDRKATITSISTTKGVTGFLDIKSQSTSNELVVNEVNKVVSYIQNKHQTIMDDVKNRRKLEIKNIQTRIDNIKNKEIKLLMQKINAQQNNLDNYRVQLNKMITNIEDISKTDPALTALKLMEKRDISTFVAELNLQLMDMRDKKDTLETTTISELVEKKIG